MEMNAQILDWLVFLALIKSFTCHICPFELDNHPLTAKEGSCVQINCTVKSPVSDDGYWFWMKDAEWNHNDYVAEIIYSTDNLKRPVDPDFQGRVKYVGSSSSSWNNVFTSSQKPRCSISICNLRINDSGQYNFRFVGRDMKSIWATPNPVTLTVTENPCLITFEKQPHGPVMNENNVTLTCSTSDNCTSNLQIEDSSKVNAVLHRNSSHKSLVGSFAADWQDDGRGFTCQVQGNTDESLKRSINVTVEYAPRNASIRKSSQITKEGDTVTFICAAQGNPKPTYSLFRKDVTGVLPQWTITSITAEDSGEYYCEASNKYGKLTSKSLTIDVTYAPDVEIKRTSTKAVRQGDIVTLNCIVKRSNPTRVTYSWRRDGGVVSNSNTYVKQMGREDSGSYTCEASNDIGKGTSKSLKIQVEYRPCKPTIVLSPNAKRVNVGSVLKFSCNTDAHPTPSRYSWYRYYGNNQMSPSLWTSNTTYGKNLFLSSVQRADEACYSCNATNSIGTGHSSDDVCITVEYPPTIPVLSMKTEVTENQTIAISCTVESFPLSVLTVKRTSTSNAQSSSSSLPNPQYDNNKVQFTFNVTSGDTGFYTCNAKNSLGSKESLKTKLVVKYTPKNVKIHHHRDAVENRTLTLYCTAESYPPVKSFSWTKDGKEYDPSQSSPNFSVKSVSLSDSGLYSCAARNEVGAGQSQAAEVKVQYAPKQTRIITSSEQRLPDGRSYITLSCSTQCHPPVELYSWYKEEKGLKTAQRVHSGQNYTVYSNQPGIYYCVAKNQINEKTSDQVNLFDGTLIRFLKISLCIILPLFVIIILVYRYRKKSTVQQGTTPACCGYLGWPSGARRGPAIHSTFLTEPSRSRDDLLRDQSHRPEAQRCQPAPDSTPAPDITVYSMVNINPRKHAPTAQKPTVTDSPARGNNQNDKQPTGDAIYAKVCKSEAKKKLQQELLPEYENVSTATAHSPYPLDNNTDSSSDDDRQLNYAQVSFTAAAAHSPYPLDDDTTDSSSDDDVHLNYAQVRFTAKPGHQRDSGSSDDYETQYSDVKLK